MNSGSGATIIRSYILLVVGLAVSFTPASSGVYQDTKPKPLTRQLRDAFGDNHEVVQRTAFVETLLAGKLTKAQLEVHLQQRALIHEAVDRVLLGADPAQHLPYGEDQKKLIPLLRANLISMGSKWPDLAIASPQTKAMVEAIRKSAAIGPYYALGVLHVYYGGITHGGRDLGAKIIDTLKVDMSYYLESGGYEEYAKKVDEIVDPAAQKEMIRGGVEAYKYIIAYNDAPVFKSK